MLSSSLPSRHTCSVHNINHVKNVGRAKSPARVHAPRNKRRPTLSRRPTSHLPPPTTQGQPQQAGRVKTVNILTAPPVVPGADTPPTSRLGPGSLCPSTTSQSAAPNPHQFSLAATNAGLSRCHRCDYCHHDRLTGAAVHTEMHT